MIHNEDIKVGYYAVVHHQDAFYLFGGMIASTEFSNTIARLDTRTAKWSKVGFPTENSKLKKCFYTKPKAGTLKYGRNGHGAVLLGEKVLIIGGYVGGGPVNNEVCSFNDTTMACVEQSTALTHYAYYPELFLVAEDFGKDKSKC